MFKDFYKVGIIGCGWISSAHMNGYNSNSKTKVVSAADLNEKQLKQFGKYWNIENLYTDFNDMLKKENLDIVSICTPPLTHYKVFMKTVRSGIKGMICEKPMAVSLLKVEEMLNECKINNCRLIISHQRRFEDRFVIAKKIIGEGTIGSLVKAEVFQGNLLTDNHGIDLINFFADDSEIKWLFGNLDLSSKKGLPHNYEAINASLVLIKFINGVEAIIFGGNYGKPTHDAHLNYDMILNGTEGRLEIFAGGENPEKSFGNYPAKHFIKVISSKKTETILDIKPNVVSTPPETIYGKPVFSYFWLDSWKYLMEEVVKSIEIKNYRSPVRGDIELKNLKIYEAVTDSAKNNQVIHFS